MAGVIIKTDERVGRQEQILRDFGYDPNNCNSEAREYAEFIAEKFEETKKEMEVKNDSYK